MRMIINGEERSLPDLPNLGALIESLGLKPDRVAVELNREIVQRARWAETPLREGDKLEIVHFVGGGWL
jgi:sulfur carrier protein